MGYVARRRDPARVFCFWSEMENNRPAPACGFLRLAALILVRVCGNFVFLQLWIGRWLSPAQVPIGAELGFS